MSIDKKKLEKFVFQQVQDYVGSELHGWGWWDGVEYEEYGFGEDEAQEFHDMVSEILDKIAVEMT